MQATLFGAFAALALTASTTRALGGGETAELIPADSQAGDSFGFAVALDGTTALIGAIGDDDNGSSSGSAYVFDTVTGAQLAKLVALDGAADDLFGYSVGIHGTTAIVGAFGDDDNGSFSGSAYLFDTLTGRQLAKLLPVDGDSNDEFGISVAIYGTTAVVGAQSDDANGSFAGSAYLFDVTTGKQVGKLLPIDGEEFALFGCAVAIHGTNAVIGAFGDDEPELNSGSAYLFDTVTGHQLVKYGPTDVSAEAYFGSSVAIEGATVLIGARHDADQGVDSGSAYLFDTLSGAQLAKLLPNDGFQNDEFGTSAALSGGLAMVGAPGDNVITLDAGATYLFDATTGQQIRKLLASDGDEGDTLGLAVGLSGTTALAGARSTDGNGQNSGSAYLFDGTQAIAVPYCFGTGDGTPCPCGNSGAQGHGCANSAFAEGARLWWDRDPCVSDDDSILRAWSSRPHQPGLFFQGDDALNGGNGLPFGDGLRCAGTHVLRLEVTSANASGRADTSIEIAETAGVAAGDVKRYQWWYRDPVASPCGNGFNLSNGLEVSWAP